MKDVDRKEAEIVCLVVSPPWEKQVSRCYMYQAGVEEVAGFVVEEWRQPVSVVGLVQQWQKWQHEQLRLRHFWRAEIAFIEAEDR